MSPSSPLLKTQLWLCHCPTTGPENPVIWEIKTKRFALAPTACTVVPNRHWSLTSVSLPATARASCSLGRLRFPSSCSFPPGIFPHKSFPSLNADNIYIYIYICTNKGYHFIVSKIKKNRPQHWRRNIVDLTTSNLLIFWIQQTYFTGVLLHLKIMKHICNIQPLFNVSAEIVSRDMRWLVVRQARRI